MDLDYTAAQYELVNDRRKPSDWGRPITSFHKLPRVGLARFILMVVVRYQGNE